MKKKSQSNRDYSNNKLKSMILSSLMCALICIISPWTVPIGPVPISLSSFIIMLAAYILGFKGAVMATFLYLLIGLTGIPVFSGMRGGLAVITGPTGGYLVGYLLLAYISGLFSEKFKRKKIYVFFGFLLGNICLYVLGTIYLSFVMNITFVKGLIIGVVPFIIPDMIKCFLAVLIGSSVVSSLNLNLNLK